MAQNLTPEEFRGFRLGLLQIIQETLQRPLELWEREMLLFPRLCRICHAFEDLDRCPNCLMEYYCIDNPLHSKSHEDYCQQFNIYRRILEIMNSKFFKGSTQQIFSSPKIPMIQSTNARVVLTNFDEFLFMLYKSATKKDYDKLDCASYASLSVTATPSLTVLHALESINFWQKADCQNLTIHIIGAELQFECADFGCWEKLFLHTLPTVKKIRLELCGPELKIPEDLESAIKRPTLCHECSLQHRQMEIVLHCKKLYHQINFTVLPDVVCLFNPGLYRVTGYAGNDTWPQTIRKFCDYSKPIIVTSYTEIELPLELERISKEYQQGKIKVEIEPRKNPFASLKPERNFISDDDAPLIYKNFMYGVFRPIGIEK